MVSCENKSTMWCMRWMKENEDLYTLNQADKQLELARNITFKSLILLSKFQVNFQEKVYYCHKLKVSQYFKLLNTYLQVSKAVNRYKIWDLFIFKNHLEKRRKDILKICLLGENAISLNFIFWTWKKIV